MIKSYKDLKVWQCAKTAVVSIYELTKNFPKEEMYGLTSQMRRAAISIPSNIAEGHARAHTKEFINFLSIALGSVAELETQIEIAIDLFYIKRDAVQNLFASLDEIGKMLRGLQRSLASSP